MSEAEGIISRLACLVESKLAPGEARPDALRLADDYLWARGWFTPRRGRAVA